MIKSILKNHFDVKKCIEIRKLEALKQLNLNQKTMNEQIPSIGRIVIYVPTELDKQFFRACHCNVSDELPAIIVAKWGDTPTSAVNLKVFTDGPAQDLWKTSICVSEPNAEGKYPAGQWHWPVKN